MSFTKLKTTQTEFLENYLRGTGRTLSSKQALSTYGIKNLRARMSDLRRAGLRVARITNTQGSSAYSVSRRDFIGSAARVFD
jgi:hypothetical protein